MPSPIAHVAAGYLIYRWMSKHSAELKPSLILAGIALSLLPDIDAVAGLLFGNMGRYHNNMMSSPFIALIMSLGVGAIGWRLSQAFRPWFLLALVCYLTHICMDFFTRGRGIMLLWPLSEERFQPPFTVFYGLHWSDGMFSSRHIWTVMTELGTLAFVALVVVVFLRIQRCRSCSASDQAQR